MLSGSISYFVHIPAFSNKFPFRLLQVLHIQNLSNRYLQIYDPTISRIFQANFWWIFYHLAQMWRAAVRRAVHVWLALLAREAPVSD